MPIVVGIRFKDSGKTYYFDPNGLEPLLQGDPVIVETVRGPELAKVAYPPGDVSDEEMLGDLKPVLRRAEPIDFERLNSLNARQSEVLARCTEKITEHGLPMRLVKAEYSFDGSRLTFYFTAEKRVDFRMLVRDLARLFRARIELRQIGPRDEAKLLGGIGPCGRILCCSTFLPDYARVSIKMAKDQDLPLNPIKISGVCGRLLCCLAYEHEQYLQIKAELPRKGAWVQTPDGPGEVVAVNVVRETVMVELAGSLVHEEYAPDKLTEATDRVASLARSRNDEGITPAALLGLDREPLQPAPTQARRERRPPPEPRRDKGEKRLLRDEIDNPDVLEALAMLEEGRDDDALSPRRMPEPAPERSQPPPAQQRRVGPPSSARRPLPTQQRRTQPPPPPAPRAATERNERPPQPPERPARPTPPENPPQTDRLSQPRRRRRKG
jgi:cell fate regulator YaaT (PSP1 superfamily)